MTSDNRLRTLTDLGQSVWLDFITRDIMNSGRLESLIEEDGLRGMTTNPTIFSKAMAQGEDYDDDLGRAEAQVGDEELFERIAVKDVQRAADMFRGVYDATSAADGYVSIEERPAIARDTDAAVEEARRLWGAVDRPNVMIKIPGTAEGLPAIESCLAEGININITLLFSVDRYREVVEAWFRGMERRAADGKPLGSVASVASFFVSRVDVMVDGILDERIESSGSEEERQKLKSIRSGFGIANARLAYSAFEDLFSGDRWERLERLGARMQRPLWASTSTKDPELPDTYYVDNLVAPDTVNTVPPDTLEAFRDHGSAKVRIHDDLEGARRAFGMLEELGIDFDEITDRLEEEGIEKFARSYDEVISTIGEQRSRLGSS